MGWLKKAIILMIDHSYVISMLGVADDELVRYPDFRRYVLEIAQREINQHTDLNVCLEPIKKGKKVTEILIHIKKNY